MTIFDEKLEFEILASCICNREALISLMELSEDDFFFSAHKKLFLAISEIYNGGNLSVDLISLRQKLLERGDFDSLGGDVFLAEFGSANIIINRKYAIERIREYSRKREIYNLSEDLKKQSQEQMISSDQLTAKIETSLEKINTIKKLNFLSSGKVFDNLDKFDQSGDYIPTQFSDLDHIIDGFFKSEMIIIAARPGVGKTAFALNIVNNMSNKNIIFVSLEMNEITLGTRLLSIMSGVDSRDIRFNRLSTENRRIVSEEMTRASKMKINYLTASHDIQSIYNQIKYYSLRNKIDIVIIDYLQLVRNSASGKQPRYVQVGEVSAKMKELSMLLNIPIIVLAQLGRNAQSEKPTLADLRESGNIEQDADMIIFLCNSTENMNCIDTYVAKNRNGGVGSCKLFFDKKKQKFQNFFQNGEFWA